MGIRKCIELYKYNYDFETRLVRNMPQTHANDELYLGNIAFQNVFQIK